MIADARPRLGAAYNCCVNQPAPFTDNDYCFACGSKNPLGMQLHFFIERGGDGSDVLCTRLKPSPHWQGFAGVMHGGLQATVMDDLMSNFLFRLRHVFVVTAELKTRFRRPVPLDAELLFTARETAHDGKVWHIRGECRLASDPSGAALTTCEGRFIEIEPPAGL